MTDTAKEADNRPSPTRRNRLTAALAVGAIAVSAFALLMRRSGGGDHGAPIAVPHGALSGWNLLLVSIDTVRADRIGCYGYASAATPTLDALAAGGVRCDQAVAPVPLTLPAHASLLTGLYPHRHGARINGVFRVSDGVVTLAERLAESGYRTGAAIAAHVLDRRYGLARGFNDYADDLTEGNQPSRFGLRERTAEQVNRVAMQWLQANARTRFFLWLHYFDPHAPYTPPEPYGGRFAGRPYDGEIAYADAQLGRVLAALKELGVRDKTLVVVVSDHGESLGEHGELTHGLMVYDATLRVPVILNAPGGLPAGLVVRRQVGLIDVMPTVLDLLGAKASDGLDGRSLLAAWPTGQRDLYVECLAPKLQHGWAPLMGLRTNATKFILAPRPELYDLQADPGESNNLFVQRRDEAQASHERLRAVLGTDPQLAAAAQGNLPMDAGSKQKLEDLGYVFTAGKGATTRAALPDPKDMIGDWRLLQRAETLADRGEHDKAIALLEPHLKARPNDVRAWQVIAESYQAAGRRDRALAAFRREAELAYRKVEARVGIGSILLDMGQLDRAEAEFRAALEEDPQSHGAVFGLGAIAARRNRPDEALGLFERCIKMARGSKTAAAYFNIGAIHHAAGRLDEGRAAFERSLADDPGYGRAARALAEMARRDGQRARAVEILQRSNDRRADPETLAAMGELLSQDGRQQLAVRALERSLDLQPNSATTHYRLALVLQQAGKADAAVKHLAESVRLDPSGVQAHLRLGVMLAGLRRTAEAEGHLGKVTKLAPDWVVGHYNLGVMLAQQDKLPEAERSFRRALKIDPQHAGAHNALGQILMSSARQAEAADHFRQALKINPNMTTARQNLNRCTTTPAAR